MVSVTVLDKSYEPEVKEVPLSSIRFDESVYARIRHNPALVQRYAECLGEIEARHNYICVASDMRIVDGRHRQLAYQMARQNDSNTPVPVYVYSVSSDDDVADLSVWLNNAHGDQLSNEDKRRDAIRMHQRANRLSQAEIANLLGVSIKKVNAWLSAILEQERKERDAKIWELWLSCHTQEEIGQVVGLEQSKVSEYLQKISESYQQEDRDIFRNFEPKVYNIWNFGKSTNEVHIFGSIPPEVLDNLLYYYTKPYDVVFDPFAGGGMTIDVCTQRLRRYYVSDLTPTPARSGAIRQWDITQGLPDNLPIPDFVFLDPPYWRQAADRYSDKPTDLGNLTLDVFIDTIANIAKQVKRKWGTSRPAARLALIIGFDKNDSSYIDLPFLCQQAIGKYLVPVIRIQVPYPTQVHGGSYVADAKRNKTILYLTRDLMIFGV